VSARRAELLEQLCSELGERAEPVPADLADRDDVARLAERASGADVLVANAGLAANGRIDEIGPDEVALAIEVNLHAPIQLARALTPGMVERGEGHVVVISSLLGRLSRARAALYSATKFGIRGFALGLREDLHGTGVGVTNVLPGFVRDVGMYVDSGAAPEPGMSSSPQEVADAVLRGIERNEAEIVVAPAKLRFGAFVATVAPGVGAKMMRRRSS
jgi:short-subunit dehydrogenase